MSPTVHKLSEGSAYLAAALVAVVAMRFAFVAVVDRTIAAPSASPSASAGAPRPARTAVDARPRDLPAGEAVRMRVVVTRGPDRAEVRVNDGVLGNVPYIGETSCRVGQPLVIELVPPKGPPERIERTCQAGVLRVE
jgi:hypothetical protein